MSSVKRRHGDSTSRRRHVQVIEAIASKHYLQVTEDHFAKAVQNPVQQAHAPSRTDGQETTKAPDRQGLMRNRATTGDVVPEAQVAGTGFQREPFLPGNSHISPEGGAKCGAAGARVNWHGLARNDKSPCGNKGLCEIVRLLAMWCQRPKWRGQDSNGLLFSVEKRTC